MLLENFNSLYIQNDLNIEVYEASIVMMTAITKVLLNHYLLSVNL